MRLTRLLVCFGLLAASLARGQWLERVIYLPDSCGGLLSPPGVVYNSANDRARVGTPTMDTRSLSAGIYLVRLETANGSATRKIVIDR